jgi:hypothetical protein
VPIPTDQVPETCSLTSSYLAEFLALYLDPEPEYPDQVTQPIYDLDHDRPSPANRATSENPETIEHTEDSEHLEHLENREPMPLDSSTQNLTQDHVTTSSCQDLGMLRKSNHRRLMPTRISKRYRRCRGPKTILDLRAEYRRDVDAKRGDLVTALEAHAQLKQELQDAGSALRMTIGDIECLVWLSM